MLPVNFCPSQSAVMEAIKLALVISALGIFCVYSRRLVESSIVWEDIECAFADNVYFTVNDAYLTLDKKLLLNFTVLKTLPENTECHAELLGSSMGEYVVPVGIDGDMEFCESLNEPIIFGPAWKAFGFKKNECPPSPGNYGSEGYEVPTENFPDFFPPDRYLFLVQFLTDNKPMLTLHITLRV